MPRHVRVKDIVNDLFPHTVHFIGAKLFKDVQLLIINQEEERGSMVIFEDGKVVIESGQFRAGLRLKYIVVTWVIQVMRG